MDLDTVDIIAKSVPENEKDINKIPKKYLEQYRELFKYVELINGVIISIGSHPSGFVVSPINLEESIGLCYTKESKYAVSQVNMKELESNNYVKLDMLGLKNIEIINETCKLAGIERLTPDNVNAKDEAVWGTIRESGLGIFQWESESAQRYLKELFSDNTIEKIKNQNENFNYMDLFSIGNGAIRPSGDSYRNDLAAGTFKDNGHEALNEFLKNTLGYLVYQEQIMNWLVEFCGYSMSEADTVRRGIAKKGGTEKLLPDIKKGFIEYMKKNYDEKNPESILNPFIQVIKDASDYGFSVNHSDPYSYIGYGCGYLRYYHPLEFLTTMLNTADGQEKMKDIAKTTEYAVSLGIKIKPIQFRKSQADYNHSNEENAIYKGMESIKFLNRKVSEELYGLKESRYETFCDLLVNLIENTSCNARQLQILIKLNFFKEFGGTNELLMIYEEFANGKEAYKKTHKDSTKEKRLAAKKEKEKEIRENLKEKDLEIAERAIFQKEMMGYCDITFPNLKETYYIVLDINKTNKPKIYLYNFNTGEESMLKMKKNKFYSNNTDGLLVGDIIKINRIDQEARWKKDESGKFVQPDPNDTEPHIGSCDVVKRYSKSEK
ncbi:hypothetical protein ERL59_18700 [Chengkuizengella sp. YPA3-1-1]|uniref:DNA-directed DNA polymerase n=2 Tax=Chengkuizengella marina TaxID=2507566 RepID=A0A6N9Q8Q6_9BACL|nr:hypothetical protein [Chengkuizengella marina]